MMNPYHYTFKAIAYECSGQIVKKEWEKQYETGADPKPPTKEALELWNTGSFMIIEVTGPRYYSTDWFRFRIEEESEPLTVTSINTSYPVTSPSHHMTFIMCGRYIDYPRRHPNWDKDFVHNPFAPRDCSVNEGKCRGGKPTQLIGNATHGIHFKRDNVCYSHDPLGMYISDKNIIGLYCDGKDHHTFRVCGSVFVS